MNTKIVAVTYQKGGSGKSSIAVNLAAVLSTRNNSEGNKNRVLIIDGDPHASASNYLNAYNNNEVSLYDVLTGEVTLEKAIISRQYSFGKKGGLCQIDIVPNNIYCERLEDNKNNYSEPLLLLKNALSDFDLNKYDYIIIDCPPQGNTLLSNIYNVANYYILPCFADSGSYLNLDSTYHQISVLGTESIERNILGSVINNYELTDTQNLMITKIDETCRNANIKRFTTVIPHTKKYDSTIILGTPIPFFHRTISNMKKLYRALNAFTE